jgi:hypothetical protein
MDLKQKMQRDKQIKKIKKELKRSMSNTDLVNVLYPFDKNVADKIIQYSELANYSDLKELLPNPNDFKIILVEDRPNRGHWTTIIRQNGNRIIYFDSYGEKVDGQFKYIPDNIERELGENIRYLSRLINTASPNDVIMHNIIQYQEDSPGITTCGRHCCARIIFSLLGYSNRDFIKKMNELQKSTGEPFYVIISRMIVF